MHQTAIHQAAMHQIRPAVQVNPSGYATGRYDSDQGESPYWIYEPTAYRYRADHEPCERCWLDDGRVRFHVETVCLPGTELDGVQIDAAAAEHQEQVAYA